MDVDEYATLLAAYEKRKPLGDWTNKPAVPATTVPAVNTTPFPMRVVITGGTVTSVKVDGVTVGAQTSGTFHVRPGSNIAWIGSAAPTWQWFFN
jgi:hypothetical protein